MLTELMDARVDIQGACHNSLSEHLLADMNYLYHRLGERLYIIKYGNVNTLEILGDDSFSKNHEVEVLGTVNHSIEEGALIIAIVDDSKQNVFMIEGVDNG